MRLRRRPPRTDALKHEIGRRYKFRLNPTPFTGDCGGRLSRVERYCGKPPMTKTSVTAVLGAPMPAEDAPARPTMIRRRTSEPEDHPLPDPPQPPPLPQRIHIDRRADKLAAEIAAGGDPDELLSDSQLSELTGLSVQWFQIARVRGFGPPFVRLSPRRVRTRRADYVAWLRARTHRSSAEYRDPDEPAAGRKRGSRVVDGRVVEYLTRLPRCRAGAFWYTTTSGRRGAWDRAATRQSG
jgi:predicted DNA-binding transcriptional regulator AlpA